MSSISDQFKGLPIGELISQPLLAAAQAQGKLAGVTEQFIKEVGLQSYPNPIHGQPAILKARTVEFDYDAVVEKKTKTGTGADEVETTTTTAEPRRMKVPLLAIVNTPSLSVKNVKIDFDMKVQSSTEHKDSTTANVSTKASYSAWWSPVSVSMTASVGSKSERRKRRPVPQRRRNAWLPLRGRRPRRQRRRPSRTRGRRQLKFVTYLPGCGDQ